MTDRAHPATATQAVARARTVDDVHGELTAAMHAYDTLTDRIVRAQDADTDPEAVSSMDADRDDVAANIVHLTGELVGFAGVGLLPAVWRRDADAADPVARGELPARVAELRDLVARITGGWLDQGGLARAARTLAEIADEVTTRLAAAARPLTAGDLRAGAEVLRAAETCARVRRRMPDTGDDLVGTAKNLVAEDAGLVVPEAVDPRDCHLRVTSPLGEEWLWPVPDLVAEYQAGTFTIDDNPERQAP